MQKAQGNSEYQDQLNKRAKVQLFQRALAGIGLLSFLGGAIFTAVGSVTKMANPEATPVEAVAPSVEEQLAAQERGYQTVLAREPQNAVALEGLARVRWVRDNPQGALEPLETLVKLYPDRPEFQQMLAEVKQKVNQTQPSTPETP